MAQVMSSWRSSTTIRRDSRWVKRSTRVRFLQISPCFDQITYTIENVEVNAANAVLLYLDNNAYTAYFT